jgi:hypothetical protein
LLGLENQWTMTGICWISFQISLGLWKFMVHRLIPWCSAFTLMSSHSVACYFFQLCCLWFSLCNLHIYMILLLFFKSYKLSWLRLACWSYMVFVLSRSKQVSVTTHKDFRQILRSPLQFNCRATKTTSWTRNGIKWGI